MYPGTPQQPDWLCVDFCRCIYVHCMVNYRPNAEELVGLMAHADPLIDAIAKGTKLEGQRAAIKSMLMQPMKRLRQIPECGA